MGEMGVTLQWARYSVMLEGYNARVREYRDEKGCCKRERESTCEMLLELENGCNI